MQRTRRAVQRHAEPSTFIGLQYRDTDGSTIWCYHSERAHLRGPNVEYANAAMEIAGRTPIDSWPIVLSFAADDTVRKTCQFRALWALVTLRACASERKAGVHVLSEATAHRIYADATGALTRKRQFHMAWFARRFDADSLLVGHRSGAVSELSDKTVLRRGRGLGGLVFASNTVRWVEDYLGSSEITHHYDGSIRAESLRRIIGAPVWADGNFFGVLMAGSREGVTFGTQAAAHLEDAARRMSDVLAAALLRERLTLLELAARETAAQLRALETRVGARLGGIRGRERDVLEEVALGKTNREIAQSLHVSECTVKSYLRHVMQRLGARNRAEAVVRAREAGLCREKITAF